jgi:hypothetical protein
MRTIVTMFVAAGFLTVQPGYTGLWYRDDRKSDDPAPRIEMTMQGFVEKNSRGRSTLEDVDPKVVRRLRSVLDGFVQYADELVVERTQRELVVDDGSERLIIYYLDSRKHERQLADGTRLETTAAASEDQIEVEMRTSDGAKIYETYTLSSADEMVLTVRLEDKQLKQPLVIRSVYTRAE